VSTTVIEVGVDVPEATLMLVWHAERFGLSQLHQLRGRVGRGEAQSLCCLVYDPSAGQRATERVGIMVRVGDGFAIANEDLRHRGPGQLAGFRQSGADRYEYADLVLDGALLQRARSMARLVLAADPALAEPRHNDLRSVLEGRFADRLKLLDVA
jgi:ATP-dependent DNA helicase RecG